MSSKYIDTQPKIAQLPIVRRKQSVGNFCLPARVAFRSLAMGSSLPQVRTNEIEESFYGFVVREQFYLTNSCYFEKLEKKLNSIYFFTIIALLITKETASVRSSK